MFKTPALRHHDYDLPRQVFAGGMVQVEGDHLIMFLQVATGESAYDGSIYLTETFDGGNTWSAPVLVVETADVNDNTPQCIVRDGVLYLIYCRKTISTNIINQVWYRTSSDWGDTWSADTFIETGHYYNIIGQPILLASNDIFVPLAYNRGAEASAKSATYTGGVTLGSTGLISGDTDTAITLNGSSGWVDIPATGMNMPTTSWAVVMWIDMTTAPLTADRLQVLLDKTGLSAANGQYCVFYDNRSSTGSPKRIRFQHGTSASVTADWNSADTDLAAGGMLACVCGTDGFLRVYWNGTLKATSSSAVSATNGSNTMGLALGKTSGAASNWLDAKVDDTAFFTEALTATQLADLYAARTTSPYGFRDEVLGYSTRYSYWRFGELTGTKAYDISQTNDGYYRSTGIKWNGSAWSATGVAADPLPATTRGLLEPEAVQTADATIHMYMRTVTGYVWYTSSTDNGATWSTPKPTTHSGVDGHHAVTVLSDDKIVMAGIAHNTSGGTPRRPLSLFVLKSPLEVAERAVQIADSGNDDDNDRYISQQLGEFSGGTYDGYIFGNYWYQDASVSPNTIDAYFFRTSRPELRSGLRKVTHGGIWVDSFNNDGTLSAPHGSYTKVVGTGLWVTTSSNRVQYDTVEATNTHLLQNSAVADCAIQFLGYRITSPNAQSQNGATFRYSDSTHFWRFDNFNGLLRIVKVNADGGTVVDSATEATDTVTGYRYAVVCSGSTIKVYRDGVQKLSTVTDAFNNTATNFGFWNYAAQGQMDTFVVMRSMVIRILQVPRGYTAALKDADGVVLAQAAESGGTITLDCSGLGVDTSAAIAFPNAMYIQVYQDAGYSVPVSNGRYPKLGHSWDIFGGDVYHLPPQPSSFMV